MNLKVQSIELWIKLFGNEPKFQLHFPTQHQPLDYECNLKDD